MKNRLTRTQSLGEPDKCWQGIREKEERIKRCSCSFSQFCMENLTFTLFSDKKQSFALKAYSTLSRGWKKGGRKRRRWKSRRCLQAARRISLSLLYIFQRYIFFCFFNISLTFLQSFCFSLCLQTPI